MQVPPGLRRSLALVFGCRRCPLSGVLDMQRQHDNAQSALFDAKARWEEELAGKQSELDAAVEDLESSQARRRPLPRALPALVGAP